MSANFTDGKYDKKLKRKEKDPMLRKNYLLCKNLKSLAFIGMWPFQSEKFLLNKKLIFFHYCYGIILYLIFFMFLISEYVELFHVWGDLEAMTTNMSVSCLYTVGVMKIYSLIRNRKKFNDLISGISQMELNIAKYQSQDIKQLLSAYVYRARRVTYFFWSLTVSTIFLFYAIPLIEYRYSSTYHVVYENGTEWWSYVRPMIFSSWFPFDKYAFPNYIIAYIYQLLMGWVGGGYHGIWDTFIVSMMLHSIGQLQILQINIENLTNDKLMNEAEFIRVIKMKSISTMDFVSNDNILEEIKYRRLIDCVNHHRYILRYCHILNMIISPIMMLYFMVCSLMLCAIGFQATLYGLSLRLGWMAEYLIAMMIQLLLFYWHGNEVIIESNKLLMSTYNCEWYKESVRFKKSLWIMRERVKLPIEYTVGRFYPMSLPTFLTILRASYSYFALLRQVQEEEQGPNE